MIWKPIIRYEGFYEVSRKYNKPLEDVGVYKHGRKWVARITREGKKNTLGSFNTKQEALTAYNKQHILWTKSMNY